MRKIIVVGAVVGAVALGGAALASANADSAAPQATGAATSDDGTATPDDSSSASATAPTGGISVEEAKQIALDRAGGGEVSKV
ncbi:MAG: hypothetical protein ACRDUA_06520, partial [Micromonosporaceae bacterium]